MTIEIALSLLAASIPLAALVIKFSSMVSPVQFVRLETQFIAFREEVRKEFTYLKTTLEKKNDET